jgi:hypothetical protein
MGAGPSQKLSKIWTTCGSPVQVEPSPQGLTSSFASLAELLHDLGGLQLQGHETTFPAEVRLRMPQLGRGG